MQSADCTLLMDIVEQISSTYADVMYLAVGLHSGYGSAQRMYVKRQRYYESLDAA